MKIEGHVGQIIFRSDQNGFSIFKMETADGDITCVGKVFNLESDIFMELEGQLIYDDRYGEEFSFSKAREVLPTAKTSVIRYLSSGLIPFIGKKTAKKIVDKLGDKALEILEEEPERLFEIKGIGKKRIEKIQAAILERKASRDSIIFLQDLGFGINTAIKISLKYDKDTIAVVKNDTYRLIDDIRGIGFTIADNIALKNGMARNDSKRILAGIKFVLNLSANGNGDCFLERSELVFRAQKLLDIASGEIDRELDFNILNGSLIKDIIGDREVVYYEYLFKAEDLVATRLAQMLAISLEDEKISISNKSFFDELDSVQEEAVHEVFKSKLTVITGGPGTGKTTIVRKIVAIAENLSKKIMLAAPTGRAAKRLEESTGLSASTIHRLLKYSRNESGKLAFEYNRDNPLNTDILIIDEASMLDIELMAKLVDAITVNTRLVLVGDADQLPSVGPGNVLRDIIDSSMAKVIRLKKIYRQGKDSNIVLNAHKINKGEFPILNEKGKDFFFIKCLSNREILDTVVDLYSRRLPNHYKFNPIEDIQVLSITKKGDLGTESLNTRIQSLVNPDSKSQDQIDLKDYVIKKSDKLMQAVNNYSLKTYDKKFGEGEGVFNGDMGFAEVLDGDARSLKLRLDDGRLASYDKSSIDELMLAYAITVHKSQGSEFKAVIVPVFNGPPLLMSRNIIYTAITRAKELVVLVGSEEALERMIENNQINRRNSSLAYRLKLKYSIFEDVYNETNR